MKASCNRVLEKEQQEHALRQSLTRISEFF